MSKRTKKPKEAEPVPVPPGHVDCPEHGIQRWDRQHNNCSACYWEGIAGDDSPSDWGVPDGS